MDIKTSNLRLTLERARALLDHDDATPTLAQLASQVGLSPSHLQRAFRRAYGVRPAEYVRVRRFGDLKRALRDGARVTDAVCDAGFGSGSRVYENTDRLLGMPPARYRDGGGGIAIRYTRWPHPWAAYWWPPPRAACARSISATTTMGYSNNCARNSRAHNSPGSMRAATNGSPRCSRASRGSWA